MKRILRVELEFGEDREFLADRMTLDVICSIEDLERHGMSVKVTSAQEA